LSSHILKPAIPNVEYSVENEHFSLLLAGSLGIDSVETQMRSAGKQKFLLVKRYDRTQPKEGLRLHQEDSCQALGVAPEKKYESEGGPGFKDIMQLMERSSQQPAADKIEIFRTAVFNFLLGNADAHGKNFSLLYAKGRKPKLAPRYDLLCTLAYEGLSDKLAMKIGGKRDFADVFQRHFLKLAEESFLGTKIARQKLEEIRDTMPERARILAAGLQPGLDKGFAKILLTGIEKRAQQLRL